ncbi:alpha/beta hydrolase [Alkalicoccus daliensis]|uniref:Acetyl esterase n=1 Tax=Alkalicoccus daliensis TaxID=745820 RepID=A0A1H0APS2_9BACI|nr:alpha/beta hydrolase [Alkalicoccus daliensis]SDN35073.1 acetyl esterase [Alkalicoccus daliensis]
MMRLRAAFKNIFLISSVFVALMLVVISAAVFLWQTTEEGRLPAKTAVVLHAINNNLVDLDINITPPRIVSGEKGGSPTILKEDIFMPVQGDVQIPARIYRPRGEGPFPIVMYYHGGAFMEGFGNLDTHDNIIRSVASRTNSIVIAPSYRLAPEHIFPSAVEDSYTALQWAVSNADSLNGDIEKITVMGDSAGGNIATVVAQMTRDRNGPELLSQVLLYPLTTFQEVPLASRDIYDSGYYLLSRSVMYRARDAYTPEEWMWSHPYTSPLHSEDLSGLPPALVITAEFDPLRDEGEQYAELLHDHGVSVRTSRYRGVMHGFISFYEVMQSGRNGMHEAASFIKQANQDQLVFTDEYQLQVRQPPQGMERVREQTEAFAIAAYLLGRSGADIFINE